jgi:hypothetical protein
MTSEVQVTIAGGFLAVTVAAVAWFSGFSALRGPRWALERVGRLRLAGITLVVIGLAFFPSGIRWLVALIVYLGLVLVLVASLLRRSLTALDRYGGLDDIPDEIVLKRLRSAQIGLLGMVGVFVIAGLVLPAVAAINFVLAAIMAGNWAALRVAAHRTRSAPG